MTKHMGVKMSRVRVKMAKLSLAMVSATGHAAVDLGDLSYQVSADDFGLVRSYNSRRMREGLFGFGWCSVLETKLVFDAEGNPKVSTCDGILRDHVPRVRLSGSNSAWIWSQGQGLSSVFRFDSQGRLIFVGPKLTQGYEIERTIDSLVLTWAGDIKFFELKERRKPPTRIVFHLLNLDGLLPVVHKIQVPGTKQQHVFQYRENLLVEVKGESQSEQYAYDPDRNMTQLQRAPQLNRKIRYDRIKDEIREIQREDGCFEIYTPKSPKQKEPRALMICDNFSRGAR